VGPIFAEQIEVTIRHHALEAGCFVVNATGWLTDAQIVSITPDESLQRALRGGSLSAVVSPEGAHLVPPLREGEGLVVADLDMALITKRKRMMDSVGHYARPELLSLLHDTRPARTVHEATADVPNDPFRSSAHVDPSDRAAGEPAIDHRPPVVRLAAR
jgi:aliphatic nitrilase